MKFLKFIALAITSLSICSCGNSVTSESNVEDQPKQAYLGNDIRYSDDLWKVPQTYSFNEITGKDDYLSNDDVQAVFLKGVNYKDNETRIFGYLGCPKDASSNNKYPGVVLVHGGGGTAYKEWVKQWVDAGYVAFAIDYQGNMPRPDCTIDSNKYDPIPGFVAPNNVGYNDANEEIENQWMYWATSAAIIANSYVRSLDYVDENKVGICGLSWGSTITSITIGYDNRFAFASDIYGCLYNFENNSYMHDNFIRNPGAMIWDDDKPFINSKMPLHVSYYLQDTNFTLNAISKSITARENVTLSVFPNWFHAHGGALQITEPIAFANSVVKDSKRLIKISEQPSNENDLVEYEVPFDVSVKKIELFYTDTTLLNGNTRWDSCTIKNTSNLSQYIPDNAKNAFVSITDSRNLVVSSALYKNL